MKKSKKVAKKETALHLAAGKADVRQVAACLANGEDPNELNPYGFNSLHLVLISEAPADRVVKVVKLLLDAGAKLEMKGGGGRTALYLAAEFCTSTKPIEYLLECGADPRATGDHGISIVENARSAKVKKLLAKVLNQAVPAKEPKLKEVRLPTAKWREVRKRLAQAFEAMNQKHIVAIQGAEQTQEDCFDACSQEFRQRGGLRAGMTGICFTTTEDEKHARSTSHLYVGFWGAPKGDEKDMRRVGKLVVAEIEKTGFVVKWDGTGDERPIVLLATARAKKQSNRSA